MDELTDQARRSIEAVETALTPDGWTVTASIVGSSVRIALDHPLTTPHAFNFANDDDTHLAFIEEALSQPEFAIVARRPERIDHPGLLKSLRAAATAHGWDPTTLQAVVRVLEANELLAEDEAIWLEQAGTTWAEHAA